MVEKKISDGTVIRISQELRDELQKRKLVPNETYDHLLKRILKVKQ